MLEVGDPVPKAALWLESRDEVTLRDLVSEGAVLLLFYLFDWSST